jgi:hypothetical protein
MLSGRTPSATSLARAIDLGAARNATDADLVSRFHPLYAKAFERAPEGRCIFRGLPFWLGARSDPTRWILLDDEVVVDLRADAHAEIDRPASHLVIAHFSDSWRDAAGGRPAGTPIGWVLPTGEPLATYDVRFDDGRVRTIPIRRRFEIVDGIIGWGYLPFEAVGHRADEVVDWRGPHARQDAGRYAPAGHAGPLTMLPGAWGPDLTGVADFVPTRDDDITLWLHAIPLDADDRPAQLRLSPLRSGEPGSAVVVAGVTVFHGTANPLAPPPRRQLRIHGFGGRLPEVDLGVAIRSLPVVRGSSEAGGGPIGWGRPRGAPASPSDDDHDDASIVDLTATPDASLRLGAWETPIAAVDRDGVVTHEGITIRALPSADIRVDVRILVDGEPSPCRVRFVAADGRYLPPLGHRDEINPGLMEDTGADILLGPDAYAYVPGEFQVDLPIGAALVEVVKGFDHRPAREHLEIGPGTREIEIRLDRALDLRAAGWRTSDSHVHFLSPSTALLQAAAEDVGFVHVLGTQWGDQFTSTQDAPWGSHQDATGRHAVVMGTENRQNLLGHLALLGARRPTLPMAAGGAPEGRLGGRVDELLIDWADRCRAAGGLVVGAHFPLPFAEIASAIVTGRIDAVEMQCFAPGLDTPPILEWYRFLDCGYRLPVLGGTDKMSAEVPVGAIRTYARLDPGAPMSFDAWASAVRAGRTFATSGPVIELTVDSHEPGDVIELPASGGRLDVRARVRAAQPVIGSLELVMNGQVVATEGSPIAADALELQSTIDVRGGAWIAARSRSEHQIHSAFDTTMASHTSPVYVEVADHPLFVATQAKAIVQLIEGTARWVEVIAAVADAGQRTRMVEQIRSAGSMLRDRIDRAAPEVEP